MQAAVTIRGAHVATPRGSIKVENLVEGNTVYSFDKEYKVVESKILQLKSKFISSFMEVVTYKDGVYNEVRVPVTQYLVTPQGPTPAEAIERDGYVFDGYLYRQVSYVAKVYLSAPFYGIRVEHGYPLIIENTAVCQN